MIGRPDKITAADVVKLIVVVPIMAVLRLVDLVKHRHREPK